MVRYIVFLLKVISVCGATLFKKNSYPKAALIEDSTLTPRTLQSAIQCAGYFLALLQKGNHPLLEYYIFDEATNLCRLGTINQLLAPPGAPKEQAFMGEKIISFFEDFMFSSHTWEAVCKSIYFLLRRGQISIEQGSWLAWLKPTALSSAFGHLLLCYLESSIKFLHTDLRVLMVLGICYSVTLKALSNFFIPQMQRLGFSPNKCHKTKSKNNCCLRLMSRWNYLLLFNH